MPTLSQIDPTRTFSLRRKMVGAINGRIRKLKGDINSLIVVEDAFGLRNVFNATTSNLGPDSLGNIQSSRPGAGQQTAQETHRESGKRRLTTHTRYAALRQEEQVQEFGKWIAAQARFLIIGATLQQIEDAFWYQYIIEGYQKGAGRAFDSVRRKEATLQKLDFYQGSKQEFLRQAFGRQQTLDSVKFLASRVFTELEGFTEDMATKSKRALLDGFVQGKGPRAIAKDINTVVDVGQRRATTIARTEISRVYNEAQLDMMENLEVEEVGVAVEWSTAGDKRVCPLCKPLEGVVLKVKESRGILPRHPQCRCAYIPANLGEDSSNQLKTKAKIRRAFDKSIKAEIPKGSKRTIAQQKKKSKWIGADKTIAKKRPKSVLEK